MAVSRAPLFARRAFGRCQAVPVVPWGGACWRPKSSNAPLHSLKVEKSSDTLISAAINAIDKQNLDFSTSLTCEVTKGLSLNQAGKGLKGLVEGYEDDLPELAAKLRTAASQILSRTSGVEEEVSEFFSLSPDAFDVKKSDNCAEPATITRLDTNENSDRRGQEYWLMLLSVRRYGENLGNIDYCYAVVDAKEQNTNWFLFWLDTQSPEERLKALTSLRVRTQAYLANELKLKDDALDLIVKDDPADRKILIGDAINAGTVGQAGSVGQAGFVGRMKDRFASFKSSWAPQEAVESA